MHLLRIDYAFNSCSRIPYMREDRIWLLKRAKTALQSYSCCATGLRCLGVQSLGFGIWAFGHSVFGFRSLVPVASPRHSKARQPSFVSFGGAGMG